MLHNYAQNPISLPSPQIENDIAVKYHDSKTAHVAHCDPLEIIDSYIVNDGALSFQCCVVPTPTYLPFYHIR